MGQAEQEDLRAVSGRGPAAGLEPSLQRLLRLDPYSDEHSAHRHLSVRGGFLDARNTATLQLCLEKEKEPRV